MRGLAEPQTKQAITPKEGYYMAKKEFTIEDVEERIVKMIRATITELKAEIREREEKIRGLTAKYLTQPKAEATEPETKQRPARRRRRMSAAARKAVSERMQKFWAAKRAEKQKK